MILAQELRRYGVRVNAIVPAARTRLTESTPGLGDLVQPPSEQAAFDVWDPANVSTLVAYLATAGAPETGKVFYVLGGQIRLFEGWTMSGMIEQQGRWTVEALAESGTISPDDPSLFTVVDSAEEGWNVVRQHYNLPEVELRAFD